MHKQEELGQIPDTVGERDQNTKGKSEILRKYHICNKVCKQATVLLRPNGNVINKCKSIPFCQHQQW